MIRTFNLTNTANPLTETAYTSSSGGKITSVKHLILTLFLDSLTQIQERKKPRYATNTSILT